jgi:hypothetical protein
MNKLLSSFNLFSPHLLQSDSRIELPKNHATSGLNASLTGKKHQLELEWQQKIGSLIYRTPCKINLTDITYSCKQRRLHLHEQAK